MEMTAGGLGPKNLHYIIMTSLSNNFQEIILLVSVYYFLLCKNCFKSQVMKEYEILASGFSLKSYVLIEIAC